MLQQKDKTVDRFCQGLILQSFASTALWKINKNKFRALSDQPGSFWQKVELMPCTVRTPLIIKQHSVAVSYWSWPLQHRWRLDVLFRMFLSWIGPQHSCLSTSKVTVEESRMKSRFPQPQHSCHYICYHIVSYPWWLIWNAALFHWNVKAWFRIFVSCCTSTHLYHKTSVAGSEL